MDDFLAGQGGEVINICDNVDRYKMPAMIVKNEGKGNGVHTRLVNVSDVAKSLHISPDYIVRFLGLSLATNTTYTAESGEGDLRGTIQKKDVRAAVRRFVDTIIRCPGSGTNKCGLPELVFEGKGKAKKAKLSYNCLACGASGIFGSRDAAAERVADIMARDLVIAKKARKNKRKDKDFSGPSTPDTDGTMPAAPVEDDDSGGEENVHGMGNAALEGIDDDYFQAAFAAAEDADVSWGDDAEDADERAKEEIANSALLARLVSTDAAVAAGPKIKDDYECSDDARALAEWLMASLKGDAPAVTAHLGELVEAKQLGEAEFVLLFWEAAAAVSGGGPRTTPLSSVLRRYAEGLAPLASASKKCEKTLLGSIEAHFGNDDNSPDLPKVVKALVRTGCVKRKVVKKWLTKKKKSKFVSNEILASIQETVMEKCGDWLDAGSTTSWSNSLSDSNAEGGDGGDDGDDGSSSSGSYYSGSSGSSDGVAIGFKASTAADGDMPVVADESDSGDDGTADSDRGGFGAPAPAAAAAGGGDDGSDSSFDIDDI